MREAVLHILFLFGFTLSFIVAIDIVSEYVLIIRLKERLLPLYVKKDAEILLSVYEHILAFIRNPLRLSQALVEIAIFDKEKRVIAITSIVVFGLSASFMLFVFQSVWIAVGLALPASFTSFLVLLRYQKRLHRLKVIKSLPHSVDGLIRCLSAGLDINRSLSIVAEEAPSALQSEFRYLLRNRDYGQSLAHAFDVMAQRLKSSDIAFLASLIAVQERSGGPLATALESLSTLLKERERLRQKRMTASSEARMSALILGGLPVLVAIGLFSFNADYRDVLIGTEAGRLFLLLGITLLIVGASVMYRMVRMEIR